MSVIFSLVVFVKFSSVPKLFWIGDW